MTVQTASVQEAHRHALKVLYARRPDLSRDETHALARVLLDDIVGLSHAHLQQPERPLKNEQVQQFDSALEQACLGRPLPYILHRREFWGLEFFVDERVLIPRPETETLVETTLARLQDMPAPRIADLGTGSGCIAISLAHARPGAQFVATDASSAALEVATLNAQRLAVFERVTFVNGDTSNWAAPLLENELAPFDAVVSNPPYIAHEAITSLQPEIVRYEPHAALDGGADGLDCYRSIAMQTRVLLAPQGFLAVELGAGQFDAVRAIFQLQGWRVEPAVLDLAGIERVLVARPMV